jgi:tetratricopeptide (TPR) repeat protein
VLGACSTLACRTPHEIEPGPTYREARRAEEERQRAAEARAEDERVAAALEALESGDLAAAHAVLGDALVERSCQEARAAFAEGRPEDGLLHVDRALALAPSANEALLLKAQGSLALAEKNIAAGGPALLITGALEDARAYFARCERTSEALLGASRTSLLLGDGAEAYDLADAACRTLTSEPAPGELPYVPERLLAESAFLAYVLAKQAEDPATPERFTGAEEALGRLLGRTPDDPWAWATLSDLHEWEGRWDEARAALERGLARVPADPELLDRLTRVCRQSGGSEEVVAALDAYAARFPESADVRWYGARERFDAATQKLMERFSAEGEKPESNADLVEDFTRAEAEFRAAGAAEPYYAEEGSGYEVVCRAGIGWAHYQDDDLQAAEASFRSMDEVVERGLEWKLEGRVLSGIDGLHLVGTRYNDREDWLNAARTYEYLHAYQPDVAVWANNTGFFYRDAAVDLELVAKRLCAAAHGRALEPDELASVGLSASADPQALAAKADELSSRARELMLKSWAGYQDAARLAPEDVRIVNDAALVLVYYLHTELELAERMLRSCLELGEKQLADESLEEDARWELKNAWGDAYQNLGVLYAVHKQAPEEARVFFERAAEIGPEPRPMLSNFWIPFLRGEIADDGGAFELYAPRDWALPCDN